MLVDPAGAPVSEFVQPGHAQVTAMASSFGSIIVKVNVISEVPSGLRVGEDTSRKLIRGATGIAAIADAVAAAETATDVAATFVADATVAVAPKLTEVEVAATAKATRVEFADSIVAESLAAVAAEDIAATEALLVAETDIAVAVTATAVERV